ncbi:hypothetical protein MUB24_13170 [Lederbergia sp. NSJ-179]|uniref:hypothetical protein n=1 Tax=Lederbergia sp. NSJ-179 TaxID=2931402 RepID=UPI001FD5BBB8|nr:hypothetical protein [Lederbergia sp. NSJ-179]MCJ7841832.1 hypothetical protein [Lederbergia sp. NSJ-179]
MKKIGSLLMIVTVVLLLGLASSSALANNQKDNEPNYSEAHMQERMKNQKTEPIDPDTPVTLKNADGEIVLETTHEDFMKNQQKYLKKYLGQE